MNSILTIDGYLGEIFETIDAFASPPFLILTSDHGGTPGTFSHLDETVGTNYTIPFYVWGPGVKAGADLYELNPDYDDPGPGRPETKSPTLPIRNGMAGNLALQLLGLPHIPGSVFNVAQQFRVSDPPDFSQIYPWLDPDNDDNGNGYSNFFEYALGADPEKKSRPDLMPRMDGQDLIFCYRANTSDVLPQFEISADLKNWWPIFEGVTYVPLSSEEIPGGRKVRLQVPTLVDKVYYRQTFLTLR